MLGILIALWSLAIWPFVIKLTVTLGSDCKLTGRFAIKTIGGALRFDWKLIHTENGPDFVLRYSDRRHARERNVKDMNRTGIRMRSLLRAVPSLQKNLRSYLPQTQLVADIRLGLGDAAATALACATLSMALGCLPRARGRVTPEFRSEVFCADIRCIAAFQLGKLILSAAIMLYAFAAQMMRQKAGGVVNG